jgi:ribulose-5-phosphate 4-epimerase/fuculose-1-phosphate aldolase
MHDQPISNTVTTPIHDRQQWFLDELTRAFADRGHPIEVSSSGHASAEAKVVIHPIDPQHPKSYRRRSKSVFVVGLATVDTQPEDVLAHGYTLLVQAMANVFMLLSEEESGLVVHFITMERGFYSVREEVNKSEFFDEVTERLLPLATSRLVIDNVFNPDLPRSLWNGDEHTEAICRAGKELARLDLLPAAFPIEQLLGPREMRVLHHLFGIGGLSYGNLSQRRNENSFWMSASGVDKSQLREVGTEVLLVTGFDETNQAILLSVPPDIQPRRVSVDAIEHYILYRDHPQIGAILHVHAWMDNIPSTHVNYPCGTIELAQEVAALVGQADDPGHTVIGLKNHGLTITGPNLDEILERVASRLMRQVPME